MMSSFEVDGKQVHYQTAGSGAPLVFVHGSGGSARQWKHLYQHFSRTRRVVAYDLIGCGANQPISVEWDQSDQLAAEAKLFSFEDDARALLAMIETIGQPVDVIAHSIGGVGTILAALSSPAAVRTLTLFEPVLLSLLRDENHPAFEPIRDIALKYRLLFQSQGSRAAMAAFVDFWNGRGSWQVLPEPVQQSMLVGANRLYLEWGILLYGRSFVSADDLARLDQQILYFCGERTIEPMKRLTEIMLSRLSNCHFVTVPGANHMAPFTHAAGVAGEIEAHIKEESSPPVLSAA
jgi:pimeloyl-ACP methyl ester carboxylesterase